MHWPYGDVAMHLMFAVCACRRWLSFMKIYGLTTVDSARVRVGPTFATIDKRFAAVNSW